MCNLRAERGLKMNFVKNASFRRGFVSGFSSPYASVFGRVSRYHVGPKDLVTESWKQVGRSVRDALDEERKLNGEAARPGTERK